MNKIEIIRRRAMQQYHDKITIGINTSEFTPEQAKRYESVLLRLRPYITRYAGDNHIQLIVEFQQRYTDFLADQLNLQLEGKTQVQIHLAKAAYKSIMKQIRLSQFKQTQEVKVTGDRLWQNFLDAYHGTSWFRQQIQRLMDELKQSVNQFDITMYTSLIDGSFLKVAADVIVKGGKIALREFIHRSRIFAELFIMYMKKMFGFDFTFKFIVNFIVDVLQDFGVYIHSLFKKDPLAHIRVHQKIQRLVPLPTANNTKFIKKLGSALTQNLQIDLQNQETVMAQFGLNRHYLESIGYQMSQITTPVYNDQWFRSLYDSNGDILANKLAWSQRLFLYYGLDKVHEDYSLYTGFIPAQYFFSRSTKVQLKIALAVAKYLSGYSATLDYLIYGAQAIVNTRHLGLAVFEVATISQKSLLMNVAKEFGQSYLQLNASGSYPQAIAGAFLESFADNQIKSNIREVFDAAQFRLRTMRGPNVFKGVLKTSLIEGITGVKEDLMEGRGLNLAFHVGEASGIGIAKLLEIRAQTLSPFVQDLTNERLAALDNYQVVEWIKSANPFGAIVTQIEERAAIEDAMLQSATVSPVVLHEFLNTLHYNPMHLVDLEERAKSGELFDVAKLELFEFKSKLMDYLYGTMTASSNLSQKESLAISLKSINHMMRIKINAQHYHPGAWLEYAYSYATQSTVDLFRTNMDSVKEQSEIWGVNQEDLNSTLFWERERLRHFTSDELAREPYNPFATMTKFALVLGGAYFLHSIDIEELKQSGKAMMAGAKESLIKGVTAIQNMSKRWYGIVTQRDLTRIKKLIAGDLTVGNAIQAIIIFTKMQPKFSSLIEVATQEAMIQHKRKIVKQVLRKNIAAKEFNEQVSRDEIDKFLASSEYIGMVALHASSTIVMNGFKLDTLFDHDELTKIFLLYAKYFATVHVRYTKEQLQQVVVLKTMAQDVDAHIPMLMPMLLEYMKRVLDEHSKHRKSEVAQFAQLMGSGVSSDILEHLDALVREHPPVSNQLTVYILESIDRWLANSFDQSDMIKTKAEVEAARFAAFGSLSFVQATQKYKLDPPPIFFLNDMNDKTASVIVKYILEHFGRGFSELLEAQLRERIKESVIINRHKFDVINVKKEFENNPEEMYMHLYQFDRLRNIHMAKFDQNMNVEQLLQTHTEMAKWINEHQAFSNVPGTEDEVIHIKGVSKFNLHKAEHSEEQKKDMQIPVQKVINAYEIFTNNYESKFNPPEEDDNITHTQAFPTMMPTKVYAQFEKLLLASYKAKFVQTEVEKLDAEILKVLNVNSTYFFDDRMLQKEKPEILQNLQRQKEAKMKEFHDRVIDNKNQAFMVLQEHLKVMDDMLYIKSILYKKQNPGTSNPYKIQLVKKYTSVLKSMISAQMKIVFQDDPDMQRTIDESIDKGQIRQGVDVLTRFMERSTFKTDDTTNFLHDLNSIVEVIEKLSSSSGDSVVPSEFNSAIHGRNIGHDELLSMIEEDLQFIDNVANGNEHAINSVILKEQDEEEVDLLSSYGPIIEERMLRRGSLQSSVTELLILTTANDELQTPIMKKAEQNFDANRQKLIAAITKEEAKQQQQQEEEVQLPPQHIEPEPVQLPPQHNEPEQMQFAPQHNEPEFQFPPQPEEVSLPPQAELILDPAEFSHAPMSMQVEEESKDQLIADGFQKSKPDDMNDSVQSGATTDDTKLGQLYQNMQQFDQAFQTMREAVMRDDSGVVQIIVKKISSVDLSSERAMHFIRTFNANTSNLMQRGQRATAFVVDQIQKLNGSVNSSRGGVAGSASPSEQSDSIRSLPSNNPPRKKQAPPPNAPGRGGGDDDGDDDEDGEDEQQSSMNNSSVPSVHPPQVALKTRKPVIGKKANADVNVKRAELIRKYKIENQEDEDDNDGELKFNRTQKTELKKLEDVNNAKPDLFKNTKNIMGVIAQVINTSKQYGQPRPQNYLNEIRNQFFKAEKLPIKPDIMLVENDYVQGSLTQFREYFSKYLLTQLTNDQTLVNRVLKQDRKHRHQFDDDEEEESELNELQFDSEQLMDIATNSNDPAVEIAKQFVSKDRASIVKYEGKLITIGRGRLKRDVEIIGNSIHDVVINSFKATRFDQREVLHSTDKVNLIERNESYDMDVGGSKLQKVQIAARVAKWPQGDTTIPSRMIQMISNIKKLYPSQSQHQLLPLATVESLVSLTQRVRGRQSDVLTKYGDVAFFQGVLDLYEMIQEGYTQRFNKQYTSKNTHLEIEQILSNQAGKFFVPVNRLEKIGESVFRLLQNSKVITSIADHIKDRDIRQYDKFADLIHNVVLSPENFMVHFKNTINSLRQYVDTRQEPTLLERINQQAEYFHLKRIDQVQDAFWKQPIGTLHTDMLDTETRLSSLNNMYLHNQLTFDQFKALMNNEFYHVFAQRKNLQPRHLYLQQNQEQFLQTLQPYSIRKNGAHQGEYQLHDQLSQYDPPELQKKKQLAFEMEQTEIALKQNRVQLKQIEKSLKTQFEKHTNYFHYGISGRLHNQIDEVKSKFDKWLLEFTKENVQWLATTPTMDNFPVYATMVSMLSSSDTDNQTANEFKAELRASTAHLALKFGLRNRLRESIDRLYSVVHATGEVLDPSAYTLAKYSKLSDKRLNLDREDEQGALAEFILSNLLNSKVQGLEMKSLAKRSQLVADNFEQLYLQAKAAVVNQQEEEDKVGVMKIFRILNARAGAEQRQEDREYALFRATNEMLNKYEVEFTKRNDVLRRITILDPNEGEEIEHDELLVQLQHSLYKYMRENKLEQLENGVLQYKQREPKQMSNVAALGTGIIIAMVLLQQRFKQEKSMHQIPKWQHRQRFANQMGRHAIRQRLLNEAGIDTPIELLHQSRTIQAQRKWARAL